MTRFLHANARGIRIFDYPSFAMELRERVREAAARLAATAGAEIEHISKSHIRKEAIVVEVLECRNWHLTPRTVSDRDAHLGLSLLKTLSGQGIGLAMTTATDEVRLSNRAPLSCDAVSLHVF